MWSNNPSSRKFEFESLIEVVNFGKGFTEETIFTSIQFYILNHVLTSGTKHPDKGISSNLEDKWPTCGKINTREGLQSVENLMKKWNEFPGMKDWMFYVEFVHIKSDVWSHSYIYEVIWSVPTPAYPEPQVTVSVHFCIEASKVKPSSFPVDVTYVFEGNKFIHRPSIPFQPKWLFDILDMKTMLFKSITF